MLEGFGKIYNVFCAQRQNFPRRHLYYFLPRVCDLLFSGRNDLMVFVFSLTQNCFYSINACADLRICNTCGSNLGRSFKEHAATFIMASSYFIVAEGMGGGELATSCMPSYLENICHSNRKEPNKS
jgi:hypothetical protein